MKRVVLIALLVAIALGGYAKKEKSQSPVLGTWKYTKGSAVNDFQRIPGQSTKSEAVSEYFVFGSNNEFKHEFVNTQQQLVKILKGKWREVDGKIKIAYSDIDFQMTLSYFFLDKDLVLGQNFNHVILNKDDMGEQINNASNLASVEK